MKRALLGLALCGCWSSAGPAAPGPAGAAGSARSSEARPMQDRTPVTIKLELIEGTAWVLPDGTTVEAKGVMYAHLAGSSNLSSCTLVVARDGQSIELGLSNAHDGSKVSETALGWRFALEMADPYHQPSRAIVEATRL